MLKRILLSLNETNEWGVVYLLDALTFYKPKKVDVAEKLIEGIIPRLTHSNPAVIISAVKIILNLLDFLGYPRADHYLVDEVQSKAHPAHIKHL